MYSRDAAFDSFLDQQDLVTSEFEEGYDAGYNDAEQGLEPEGTHYPAESDYSLGYQEGYVDAQSDYGYADQIEPVGASRKFADLEIPNTNYRTITDEALRKGEINQSCPSCEGSPYEPGQWGDQEVEGDLCRACGGAGTWDGFLDAQEAGFPEPDSPSDYFFVEPYTYDGDY